MIACIGMKLRLTPVNSDFSFSSLESTTTLDRSSNKKFLYFDKSVQVALVNLFDKYFVNLAFVEERYLVDFCRICHLNQSLEELSVEAAVTASIDGNTLAEPVFGVLNAFILRSGVRIPGLQPLRGAPDLL